MARLAIDQGTEIGQPSRIEAEVESAGRVVRAVRVVGSAVAVLRGEMTW